VTIPEVSPLFATLGTYPADGDPWEGLPVRVDPGSTRRAEGYEPDSLPAAWLNHAIGTQGDWLDYLREAEAARAVSNFSERFRDGLSILRIASRGNPIASLNFIPALPQDHAIALVSVDSAPDEVRCTADGKTWPDNSSGLAAVELHGANFFDTMWHVVGSAGEIYRRPAGGPSTAWTLTHGPAGATFRCVASGGGVAVAMGDSGRWARSTDGITWTNQTALGAASITDVVRGGGLFVAVSGQAIWTSTNGTTWTLRRSPLVAPNDGLNAESRIAYDPTRNLFYVSDSPDGVRQAAVSSFSATDPATITTHLWGRDAINGLACLGGIVAACGSTHIRYSTDRGATRTYEHVIREGATTSLVTLHGDPILGCFFAGAFTLTDGLLLQGIRGVK